MSILKNRFNCFNVELDKEHTEQLQTKLRRETIKLHSYTYKIKQVENNDNTCKYQLLPIPLSSGGRNCFTPIIWIEITDFDDISNVVVTLRPYIAVSVMLAVFCIGAILIEIAMLVYWLYSIIVYRSTFTLKALEPFVSFLIIPSAMVVCCYFTFRNIRNDLLDKIKSI